MNKTIARGRAVASIARLVTAVATAVATIMVAPVIAQNAGEPPGPRYHHYVFELYALNANLDLPDTASRDDLLKAMDGKIVAKAAYVGRFRGDPPK